MAHKRHWVRTVEHLWATNRQMNEWRLQVALRIITDSRTQRSTETWGMTCWRYCSGRGDPFALVSKFVFPHSLLSCWLLDSPWFIWFFSTHFIFGTVVVRPGFHSTYLLCALGLVVAQGTKKENSICHWALEPAHLCCFFKGSVSLLKAGYFLAM